MNYSVLIIGDGSAAISEIYSLLEKGFMPVIGPSIPRCVNLKYDEISSYGSILVIAGDTFPQFPNEFSQVLSQYVYSGGNLIGTPFLCWSVSHSQNNILDAILPVEGESYFEDKPVTWRFETIPSWNSIGLLKSPRIVSLVGSGEDLRIKKGAIEWVSDTTNKCAAISMKRIGKGSVWYFNITHHSHKSQFLPVWQNLAVSDLLKMCLADGDFSSLSSLGIKGSTNSKSYWSEEMALSTDEVYKKEQEYQEAWKNFTPLTKRIAFFYTAHTPSVIDENGNILLEGDQGYNEYFSSSYNTPTEKYIRLISKIPQIPYITMEDDDFLSMSHMERIGICRELLRIVQENDLLKIAPIGVSAKLRHTDELHERIYTTEIIQLCKQAEQAWYEKAQYEWKKRALERLTEFIFLALPDLSVERIDNYSLTNGNLGLLVRHARNSPSPANLPNLIVVRVEYSLQEIDFFERVNSLASEIEQLNVRTGILVTEAPIPNKYARIIADLVTELHQVRKIRVVLITLDEITRLTKFHSFAGPLEQIILTSLVPSDPNTTVNYNQEVTSHMCISSTLQRNSISAEERIIHLNESSSSNVKDPPIVTVLFLAADPTDASRLRLGEEAREIQEKLQLSKFRDRFELHQRMSVRPADISQSLLDIQPHIVHFSGHGTAAGALCFENQWGNTHPIQPDALAALFEQFASQVNCVVLNACYSEIQANAIAKHIDYVVGMNQVIGDEAAIAFAVGFYQALGAGRAIEAAYQLGRVHIMLQSIPEHLTPVLIQKGQIQR